MAFLTSREEEEPLRLIQCVCKNSFTCHCSASLKCPPELCVNSPKAKHQLALRLVIVVLNVFPTNTSGYQRLTFQPTLFDDSSICVSLFPESDMAVLEIPSLWHQPISHASGDSFGSEKRHPHSWITRQSTQCEDRNSSECFPKLFFSVNCLNELLRRRHLESIWTGL